MSYRGTSERYGRVAVGIHWASALVIAGALASGFQAAGLTDPETKAAVLRVHVLCGTATLVLTAARILWHFADRRPEPVAGMGRVQTQAASLIHRLLYLVLLVMGASGIGMLLLSGAGTVLFRGTASAGLPDFWVYPQRVPHAVGARLMLALLLLHAGAALHHQFIRRDGLMRRMWFTT